MKGYRYRLLCSLAVSLFALLMWSPRTGSGASAAGAYTIAAEATSGALLVNHGSGFTNLGGATIDAPAVVALPDGTDLYIVTGQDHQLYERTDSAGWQLLSTVSVYCLYNPGATVSGSTLVVSCIGGDHGLYYASTTVPASGLPTASGWAGLGGYTNNGAAVAPVGGTVTFFVIGGDHALYSRTMTQSWVGVGGWCQGHPSAASSATTTYVTCVGGDKAIYYKTNSGSGWSGFLGVGGSVIDGAGVAATSSGPVFVAEGGDTNLYGNATNGWYGIGGSVQHGAAAVADVTSSTGSTTGTCPGSQSACIQAMLNIVNQDRAKYGVAPLTINSTQSNGTSSCSGSYGHSVAMAQSGQIWHVNSSYPQASFPNDLCISYSTAGENVGMSSSGNELQDLQSIDNMMMSETPNTPSTCGTTVNHACNILNAAYHQIGIGIYYTNNTTWLTEDFTN